jgi:hypothetical protein
MPPVYIEFHEKLCFRNLLVNYTWDALVKGGMISFGLGTEHDSINLVCKEKRLRKEAGMTYDI